MVKFTVETRLSCSATMYIADKDTAVYKKFHVRALRSPQPLAISLGRDACLPRARLQILRRPFATTPRPEPRTDGVRPFHPPSLPSSSRRWRN